MSDTATVTNINNTVLPYLGQDFQAIKTACLANNILFIDTLFPATTSSIAYSGDLGLPISTYTWARPKTLNSSAVFTTAVSASQIPGLRLDIDEGPLKNSYVVSTFSSLCQDEQVASFVIQLDDNLSVDFQSTNYIGAFHFRFYRLGQWYDVVVDDQLPVVTSGGSTSPVFARSAGGVEFWPSLIEKAYAKFFGSYQALTRGNDSSEVLISLTGGFRYSFPSTDQATYYNNMVTQFNNGAYFSCVKHLPVDEKGLVANRVYSITSFHTFIISSKPTRLIRLRNPLGSGEWNGAWSDNSRLWNQISSGEKAAINFVLANDGEFWMNFNDFLSYFDFGCVTLLPRSANTSIPDTGTYQLTQYVSNWGPDSFATGSDPLKTPQYPFSITSVDTTQDNRAAVSVSLAQQDQNTLISANHDAPPNNPLNYIIYQLNSGVNISDGLQSDGSYYFNSSQASFLTWGLTNWTNQVTVYSTNRLLEGNYFIAPVNYDSTSTKPFCLIICVETYS